MRSARDLTALRLGEDRARAMGVAGGRARFLSLIRVSLLAGTVVAFVGIIAFVGLHASHIARLCVGEDQRLRLLATGMTEALVLSLVGIASSLIAPGVVISSGIVTALLCLSIFFAVILKGKRS